MDGWGVETLFEGVAADGADGAGDRVADVAVVGGREAGGASLASVPFAVELVGAASGRGAGGRTVKLFGRRL